MSAAIDQIDASLGRVRARLKAMHWDSEARKAENERTTCGTAWARVCATMAQAWKEEAEQ
jgi:hypothetical protein